MKNTNNQAEKNKKVKTMTLKENLEEELRCLKTGGNQGWLDGTDVFRYVPDCPFFVFKIQQVQIKILNR